MRVRMPVPQVAGAAGMTWGGRGREVWVTNHASQGGAV
jgi:hypothetical protein